MKRLRVLLGLGLLAVGGAAVWAYLHRELAELQALLPKQTTAKRSAEAIAAGATSLNSLGAPNLYAGLSIRTLQLLVDRVQVPAELGVKKITLSTGDQVLSIQLSFDTTLEQPKGVRIAGVARGSLAPSLQIDPDPRAAHAILGLKPAFDSLDLDALDLGRLTAGEQSRKNVARGAEEFLSRLAGILDIRSVIPVAVFQVLDPRRSVSVAPGTTLEVHGEPQAISASVVRATHLIDKTGLEILAVVNLEVSGGTAKAASPQGDNAQATVSTFRDLRSAFELTRNKVFPTPIGKVDAWVVLPSATMIGALDATVRAMHLCANLNATALSIPVREQTIELRQEDIDAINCEERSERNCSPDQINCTPDRDCSASQIDCGGYQWYQAPDKIRCELQKSAWKLDCERIKTMDKGACEVRKSAWKLDCERIKATNRGLCETGKGALDGLRRTGPLGRIQGEVVVDPRVGACLTEIRDAGNGKLTARVGLSGGAEVQASVHFEPLNLGYLACQAPWSDRFRFTVRVQDGILDVPIRLEESAGDSRRQLRLVVEPPDLTVSTQPTLLDALRSSANFTLACIPAQAILGVMNIAVPDDKLPPELRGALHFKPGPMAAAWPLDAERATFGSLTATARPYITTEALGATVALQETP